MGSGTAIVRAIKKYGVSNFKKEILETFASYEAALAREKDLVTSEFLLREDVYNLRCGGVGGFQHINSLPAEERLNVKSFKQKVASGEIIVGGTTHWTEDSFAKVRATGWGKLMEQGIINPAASWENLTDEQRQIRSTKQSIQVSGDKNPTYGTHIYIDPIYDGKITSNNSSFKKRFKANEQPIGWITVQEWKENKKNKTNSAYGKHWYNDGTTNFYLFPTDNKIIEINLVRGRLNCIFIR